MNLLLNVAWDNLAWDDRLIEIAQKADAICFGTLAQRSPCSADSLQKLVRNTPAECLRVFYINLRFPHVVDPVIPRSLELCNALKLNDEELPYLAQLLGITGSEDALVYQVMEKYQLKLVALTRGAQGAKVYQGSDQVQSQTKTRASRGYGRSGRRVYRRFDLEMVAAFPSESCWEDF